LLSSSLRPNKLHVGAYTMDNVAFERDVVDFSGLFSTFSFVKKQYSVIRLLRDFGHWIQTISS